MLNSVTVTVTTTTEPVPVPVPSPTTPPPTSTFQIGAWVSTTAKLNVRTQPSTSSQRLGSQYLGAKGQVTAGPVSAEGYTWWNIDYTTLPDGWSVESFLTASTPPTGVSISATVITTERVNVRSFPLLTAPRLGRQAPGSIGTVIDGPINGNGYSWWNVDFTSGADGWVVGDYLVAR